LLEWLDIFFTMRSFFLDWAGVIRRVFLSSEDDSAIVVFKWISIWLYAIDCIIWCQMMLIPFCCRHYLFWYVRRFINDGIANFINVSITWFNWVIIKLPLRQYLVLLCGILIDIFSLTIFMHRRCIQSLIFEYFLLFILL